MHGVFISVVSHFEVIFVSAVSVFAEELDAIIVDFFYLSQGNGKVPAGVGGASEGQACMAKKESAVAAFSAFVGGGIEEAVRGKRGGAGGGWHYT